jgi:hypothetical protein
LAGFSNADIDSWLAAGFGSSGSDASNSSCARLSQIELKARRCATALAACQETAGGDCIAPLEDIASEIGPVDATDPSDMASISQSLDTGDLSTSDVSECNASNRPPGFDAATTYMPVVSSHIAGTSQVPEAETSSGTCHDAKRIIPSCKLLSRLAENPAADITQAGSHLPSSSDGDSPQDARVSQRGAGIECRKAYDMLIRFATTEEKMDTIARALESGCTKNGKVGCAVKTEVVLHALDGMCG